jgi:aminopeptidase N
MRAHRFFPVVAALIVLAGCGPTAAPTTSSSPSPGSTGLTAGADGMGDPYFPKEGNGGYDVETYTLTIDYDPASRRIVGREVMTAIATQGLSQFDLDLHGLTVDAIYIDGDAAKFSRTGDELVVAPAGGLADGREFTADIRYAGSPTGYSDPLLGQEGFLPTADGAIAQGEPDVAASWFAVNDHPRDKATYTIVITAPNGLAALSNGVLASKTTDAARTTWTWVENRPMASYLAFVVIGHYRVSETVHNNLSVVTAVQDSLTTKIDAWMADTPAIVDFLATQFGPYPFDSTGGVVHNDPRFNFALENQTRPVYTSSFFRSQTSADLVQAHELAHQWYGDSVSVANWRDIWLNEGFATYAEWLWSAHVGDATVQQSFDQAYQNLPLNPPGDPGVDNLFGQSVYQRGAATLQALRIRVGDATFFKIIRDWAQQKQYGNGSTAEFIALAEKDSGASLSTLFNDWLYQQGKPPYPTK